MNSPVSQTRLDQIINLVSEKNPQHGKKLKKTLGVMETEFYDKADTFFAAYEKFATSQGKDFSYGVDSYLQMIADMMGEYLDFARTGEYSCKSFSDAFEKVYNNPDVMEGYMHGLLFSQFLWKHHYSILDFYSQNITSYGSDLKSYLEIGGGHGLYVSEAINKLGDSLNYNMLDISESSLDLAKMFIQSNNVNYILSDIFEFQSKDKFDFISMGEVLEHVEDPGKLLSVLNSLLSDNGVIFITVPTNAPAIDHIYLFRNAFEIEELIEAAGFTIDKSIGVYSEDVSPEKGERDGITMMYAAFLKKV